MISRSTVRPSRTNRDRVSTVALLVALMVVAPWRTAAAQAGVTNARSPSGVRIITQDRPAGIPIADYSAKRFGRAATSEAVRQYNGRSLDPAAFAAIAEWTDTRALDVEPCTAVGGKGCATPTGVWVAITRIERGELPHEINLSYTTQFTAAPALEGQAPQTHRYTFCERWLRVGSVWKYDGFVKMVPQ